MPNSAVLKLSAALGALFLSFPGWAQLPSALEEALARTSVSLDEVAVWVSPAGINAPVVAHRTDCLMQPASSVKVVTTLAGLDLLKPDFTWKTQIRAQTLPDKAGAVRSVSLIGSGDPHLMIEQVWLLVEQLRQTGVKRIIGDITVDRSAFGEKPVDQGAFDGAADRSYNVAADAALVNLKAVSITLEPEENGKWARVTSLPVLEGFSVPKRIALSKGACGDWKSKVKASYSDKGVRFKGDLPASCGVKALHVSRWEADDYLTRLLKPILRSVGIAWTGVVREGRALAQSGVRLAEIQSQPLPTIVSLINKYSNNTMARHVFLTLSQTDPVGTAKPATLTRSRAVTDRWLVKAAGEVPSGTFIDNGSGLSRKTRITAETMGRVLNYGFRSYVMPEFMASLPLAGFDGTMKKRGMAVGSAHVKTGLIRDVRSIAGYVTDINARRWSVVVMMNGKRLDGDRIFSQAVLQWCAQGGAQALWDDQRKGSAAR